MSEELDTTRFGCEPHPGLAADTASDPTICNCLSPYAHHSLSFNPSKYAGEVVESVRHIDYWACWYNAYANPNCPIALGSVASHLHPSGSIQFLGALLNSGLIRDSWNPASPHPIFVTSNVNSG